MIKNYVDSNFDGKIRHLTSMDEDCDKLATLFNTFDPVWPAGFTGGKPYDRQRAKEYIERQSAIEILIAETPNNKFGAYCSLYERKSEPEVSYIALLGADPSLHGKKYGKNILIRAIEIAMEKGYKRVDLHTWPSNMEAVPLYKKTGYFWMPNTGVYMQNFIPTILKENFFKSFFSLCDYDWYQTQIREFNQKHDDIKEKNNAVFPYEFSFKDNRIKAVFDIYSRELTGVEKSINNEKISIKAYTDQHEISVGDKAQYILDMENNTNENKSIVIMCEGFKGISFLEDTSTTFVLQAKDKKTIKIPYELDPKTTPIHERNKPSVGTIVWEKIAIV